jgi:hypothetical protein
LEAGINKKEAAFSQDSFRLFTNASILRHRPRSSALMNILVQSAFSLGSIHLPQAFSTA